MYASYVQAEVKIAKDESVVKPVSYIFKRDISQAGIHMNVESRTFCHYAVIIGREIIVYRELGLRRCQHVSKFLYHLNALKHTLIFARSAIRWSFLPS